jgi:hypothetical protein
MRFSSVIIQISTERWLCILGRFLWLESEQEVPGTGCGPATLLLLEREEHLAKEQPRNSNPVRYISHSYCLKEDCLESSKARHSRIYLFNKGRSLFNICSFLSLS